ncbi:hypothetical protein Q2T76_01955 [Lactobacillus sp. YT155]|uniref:hypothetical protein n=1 Tax=Lactobacillus sp. YT155 TaxID=3060955 RepID=UPI00265E5834|nr:hypothetical protein [Lactobacillus sp. YT155]MDO1604813.1 hypothetical protein [Lactobacillus sp. YT155]
MKNKIMKYMGIGAAIIVVIGIIWGIVANQNNHANKQATLKFEKVTGKDAKIIHDDVRSMFGMGPMKEGSELGVGYKPGAYKAEKINDQYGLYIATMRGKKLSLDGTKINSYIGNKFYSDVYGYQKEDEDFVGTNSAFDFYQDLIKEVGSSDTNSIMLVDISTKKVEYNKIRKIYRVEATGETTWIPMDHGGQKMPIVMYLDKDFNITDIYYGKTFAKMKGNLSQDKIQKGLQGINDIQYDIHTKKVSMDDAIEQHKIGQQIVGKNQTEPWLMSHQVLLSYRAKNYADGKLVKNLIPVTDAKGNYTNQKEFDKAQKKITQAEEKEAGGKINEDKRMIEKVDSVEFDNKRQLTKVKTTVTVTLKNGKKGSYKQTYFLDENYHILASYVGAKQP